MSSPDVAGSPVATQRSAPSRHSQPLPGRRPNLAACWAGFLFAPGIVLSISVFAFNLLGDSLRDFFDTRLQR